MSDPAPIESPCPACTLGLPSECFASPDQLGGFLSCLDVLSSDSAEPDAPTGASMRDRLLQNVRAPKDDDSVRDQTSTGRKRAAQMYPVSDGMLCEWANLKFAGGGSIPMVGCRGNVLQAVKREHAIHHGPDKSTLNNEHGNVHRICIPCHNRWHALNDPFYGERPNNGQPFVPLSGDCLPHDPETLAAEEDFEFSEMYWGLQTKKRQAIDYRSENERRVTDRDASNN